MSLPGSFFAFRTLADAAFEFLLEIGHPASG